MTETQVRELVAAYKVFEANEKVLNVFAYEPGAGIQVCFEVLITIGTPTFALRTDSYFSHTGHVTIDGVRFYAVVMQPEYDHYTAGVSPASAGVVV